MKNKNDLPDPEQPSHTAARNRPSRIGELLSRGAERRHHPGTRDKVLGAVALRGWRLHGDHQPFGVSRDHHYPGLRPGQNGRHTAGLEDVWSARNSGRTLGEAEAQRILDAQLAAASPPVQAYLIPQTGPLGGQGEAEVARLRQQLDDVYPTTPNTAAAEKLNEVKAAQALGDQRAHERAAQQADGQFVAAIRHRNQQQSGDDNINPMYR